MKYNGNLKSMLDAVKQTARVVERWSMTINIEFTSQKCALFAIVLWVAEHKINFKEIYWIF
jgi:hypothetical protein